MREYYEPMLYLSTPEHPNTMGIYAVLREPVDGVLEQTAETFTATLPVFRTKRDLGDLYKMNSGTWTQEMNTFEAFFAGKTAEELKAFFERQTAANGRVIREGAEKEEDLAKWNALTDEEKANVDALTGATMSLSDAHGDILGALLKAAGQAKALK